MTLLRRSLVTVLPAAILLLLFWVPWWELVAASDWPLPVEVTATVVFAVAFFGLPVLLVLGHGRQHRDLAARVADSLLGLIWVLFVWSLAGGLLHIALALAGVDDPTWSRTIAVAVLLVVAVLVTVGYRAAMRVPPVRTVTVSVPRLGRDLDGLRVVVLADTHFGPIDRRDWSAGVVAAVNELDADVVCHVGDLADGTVAQRRPQVQPLAGVRARLARLYITGNHEYFSEPQQWLDHMRELGWQPLHNEHLVLCRGADRVVFAGIDDAAGTASGLPGHGADLVAALAGVAAETPVVLLAHQPKQVRLAAAAGVDLQLSGHTHGGQIWPFHFVVMLDQPSLHGLTRHGARTQLYTSRGTGFWGPPLRIFAPAEITLLILRSSEHRTSP